MKYTRVLLLTLLTALLLGCDNKEKSTEVRTFPCSGDSALGGIEQRFCSLYHHTQPRLANKDPEAPGKKFLESFSAEIRTALGAECSGKPWESDCKYYSPEAILYNSVFQETSGLRVERYDSIEATLTVRFENYGDSQTVVYVLKAFVGTRVIADVIYPDGYSLRDILGLNATGPVSEDPKLLDSYLKARTHWIKNSDGLATWGEDSKLPALEQNKELNNLFQDERAMKAYLHAILGRVDIPGFAGGPTRNNLTKCGYADGCTNMDGLLFRNGILVTTPALMKANRVKEIPGLDSLSRDDEVYNDAFAEGASFMLYGQMPVKGTEKLPFAYVGAGIYGQDYGPFTPHALSMLAQRDGRLFIAAPDFEGDESITRLLQIDSCEKIFQPLLESLQEKCGPPCNEYRPGEKDLMEIAQEAYGQCYLEKMPGESFYPDFLHKAQALLDQITVGL